MLIQRCILRIDLIANYPFAVFAGDAVQDLSAPIKVIVSMIVSHLKDDLSEKWFLPVDDSDASRAHIRPCQRKLVKRKFFSLVKALSDRWRPSAMANSPRCPVSGSVCERLPRRRASLECLIRKSLASFRRLVFKRPG